MLAFNNGTLTDLMVDFHLGSGNQDVMSHLVELPFVNPSDDRLSGLQLRVGRAGNLVKKTVSEEIEGLRVIELLRDVHVGISKGQNIVDHVLNSFVHTMRVHLLEEGIARVEHGIEIIHFLAVETDLLIDNTAELHQTREIVGRLEIHVVAISSEVVKFVHIHRIPRIGNNVKNESFVVRVACGIASN